MTSILLIVLLLIYIGFLINGFIIVHQELKRLNRELMEIREKIRKEINCNGENNEI